MDEKYELMVIIKPNLAEDQRAAIQKSLADYIAELKGEITNTDVWGKKHLTYKIAGQNEGYYVVYNLSLMKANTSKLEYSLKLNQDILRYLLIKVEK